MARLKRLERDYPPVAAGEVDAGGEDQAAIVEEAAELVQPSEAELKEREVFQALEENTTNGMRLAKEYDEARTDAVSTVAKIIRMEKKIRKSSGSGLERGELVVLLTAAHRELQKKRKMLQGLAEEWQKNSDRREELTEELARLQGVLAEQDEMLFRLDIKREPRR